MSLVTNTKNTVDCVEIVKNYPLAQIFPRNMYSQAGKSMALHYLIALGQPFEKINQWITNLKDKILINHHDAKNYYDLTPLNVCVLANDQKTAELLIKNGADPLIPDHKGWTPFHHLAVTQNEQMTAVLKTAKGVNEKVLSNLRNCEDGTCADIKEMLNCRISDGDNLFNYRNAKGEIVAGSQADFNKLTEAKYYDSVFVTPSELIKIWTRPVDDPGMPEALKLFIREKLIEYLERKPNIYMGKEEGPQGWDVYAGEDLEAVQGITIYGGELCANSGSTEYLCADVNGKKLRNLGPIINDGFPNCLMVPVNYHGIAYSFIIASQKIKKGERLLWNYGFSHPVKLDHIHLELNQKGLEKFIETTSLLSIFQNICKSDFTKLSGEACAKKVAEGAKIGYILETPNTLISLLSTNTLPYKDIQNIVKSSSIKRIVGIPDEALSWLISFAESCSKVGIILDKLRGDKKNQLVQKIEKFLAKCSSSFTGQCLIGLMVTFPECLSKITSIEQWQVLEEESNNYTSFFSLLVNHLQNNTGNDDCDKLRESLKKLGPFTEHTVQRLNGMKKDFPTLKESIDKILS